MISFISEIQSLESLTNCSNIALSPFLDVDTEKSPKDLDLEIDDAKSLFNLDHYSRYSGIPLDEYYRISDDPERKND